MFVSSYVFINSKPHLHVLGQVDYEAAGQGNQYSVLVLMCWCTGTDVLVYWCTGVLVLMCWCTGVLGEYQLHS